jgi:hypothetical protein
MQNPIILLKRKLLEIEEWMQDLEDGELPEHLYLELQDITFNTKESLLDLKSVLNSVNSEIESLEDRRKKLANKIKHKEAYVDYIKSTMLSIVDDLGTPNKSGNLQVQTNEGNFTKVKTQKRIIDDWDKIPTEAVLSYKTEMSFEDKALVQKFIGESLAYKVTPILIKTNNEIEGTTLVESAHIRS